MTPAERQVVETGIAALAEGHRLAHTGKQNLVEAFVTVDTAVASAIARLQTLLSLATDEPEETP